MLGTDGDVLSALTLVATLATALAAAVAAVFSATQAYASARSTRLQDQHGRTGVLLEVADRWTAVLPARYEVRQRSFALDAITQSHGKVDAFLASEEWRLARQVCNFYEFVGMIAYYGILRVETILVLVTVDPADFARLKPVIDYLRTNYRPDIYLFWDYLLERTKGVKAHDPFRDRGRRHM